MDFNKYATKGNQLLDEVAEELGFPNDRELATRMLRSTLHVLRDILTIEESIQIIAQLPHVMKVIYVENWKYPNKLTEIKHVKDFVRRVVHEDYPEGHHDFQTVKDGENAVMAVLKVLRKHVSEDEIKEILATIPEELRPLWGAVYV